KGFGNACRDVVRGARVEGVRDGANMGTSIHGPFLPMNPSFADELLAAALRRKGSDLPPADDRIAAVDELARKAREAIVVRVGT
ncbi:MAG: cobyric acid synthase, partial [Terrimesophilobacter sp.]